MGKNAFVATNRTSALAALDRMLCIPNGIAFLCAHALAMLSGKSLTRTREDLESLFGASGGKRRAARVLQRYLRGNANGGAALLIIEGVVSTLDTAARRRHSGFCERSVVRIAPSRPDIDHMIRRGSILPAWLCELFHAVGE